ncbi:cytochrome P450 [Aaosphaeria arxii CBS 175.79]|uniref:Cytochrome P450 n=1 Tax=Aaosphaeria arxii CBS 175.79 TaxID=1450172 RepID=A0A6A5XDU3_9PLEO|nr:cytochrome P450 [Aaosphaeria arxii CBS 175.79]KAF2011043.1 cytochrome P450 [Aaosphaeria arxii CBS 175.79]
MISVGGLDVVAQGILVASLCIATIFLYAFYNVYLHPLRSYPGPRLWCAFRLPYVVSVQRGKIHTQLTAFHGKYGPVVRIAPNELSYADGAAWKDIYASRPGHLPFKRNPTWFKKQHPDEPESIMGPDEDAHARMRRAFANSFSEKSLRDQSPAVEGYVSSMIDNFKRRINLSKGRRSATVDLTQWLNFLTFDISGDLSFGESFDCVKTGKMHYWVEIVQDFGKGLAMVSALNQYPPIDRLLRFVIPEKIKQRQLDHRRMSAEKAKKRVHTESNRPDFVTPALKYTKDKNQPFTDDEWAINMMIVVFAGSETTASALTAIMRELVQNRGVLQRLSGEVRQAFDSEQDITIASTGNLAYLNAVINEGLRLDPPVVIGVPRVMPKGGDIICGKFVPENTYVTYNQYPSNRQPSNFHSPNTFLPERFLSPAAGKDDFTTFQPFGIGRHSCIGMKLALAEMRLVVARLVYAFDFSLKDAKDRWDWGAQDTFIFWDKKPLNVVIRLSGEA